MKTKAEFDQMIYEVFPVEVGHTYIFNGQEVVALEATTENGVEGFKVSPAQSNEVLFAPKGSLKTKAQIALEKNEE